MDEKHATLPHRYSLWHLPSATLLVTTDERGVALQMEAALLAAGTPAQHLRLHRVESPDRSPMPRREPKPLAVHSKWF